MTEFRLNTPITVFGHATDHIAFTGDSIIAVLDLPAPRPLARQLELETAIDTPAKAMFGQELVLSLIPISMCIRNSVRAYDARDGKEAVADKV